MDEIEPGRRYWVLCAGNPYEATAMTPLANGRAVFRTEKYGDLVRDRCLILSPVIEHVVESKPPQPTWWQRLLG